MFVPILAYHKIQDEFDLGITYIKPKQFEKQVRYLYENNYKTVSIMELLSQNSNSTKMVALTFDDAYASIFNNALPILKRYNFTATIFVITKFVGALNDWDYQSANYKFYHCDWQQLRRLAAEGWEIGSHSVTHRDLRLLTKKQTWHELRYSKDLLENKLQRPVEVISYPFGRFDSKIIECAKKAGYLAGCTLGHVKGHSPPYALVRRGVYSMEPFTLFKIKLQDNLWSHCDDIKQRMISGCANVSSGLRSFKYN